MRLYHNYATLTTLTRKPEQQPMEAQVCRRQDGEQVANEERNVASPGPISGKEGKDVSFPFFNVWCEIERT